MGENFVELDLVSVDPFEGGVFYSLVIDLVHNLPNFVCVTLSAQLVDTSSVHVAPDFVPQRFLVIVPVSFMFFSRLLQMFLGKDKCGLQMFRSSVCWCVMHGCYTDLTWLIEQMWRKCHL